MKCPRCGSERIAEMLYGMPAFDDDLKRRLDSKEVYLGGCCISEFIPRYHCNKCRKDFGTAPYLFGRDGQEDYRDVVTSIHFEDGGFFHGFVRITISRSDEGIKAEICPRYSSDPVTLNVSEEEWRSLVDALFCKLFLHEWKKSFVDPDILDGEQWELKLQLTGSRVRNYHGSNDYPACWDELRALFLPYCQAAGIETE